MPAVIDRSEPRIREEGPIFPDQAERAVLGSIEALLRPADGRARLVSPEGESIDLPPSLFAVLQRALHELRLGNGIAILPIGAQLTTREASEILNVSRPFLIKLLEQREIPHRKVGTHRRVRLDDLLAYKRRQDRERRELLRELAEEAEEFGFYEEWQPSNHEAKQPRAAAKQGVRKMGKNQHVVPSGDQWGVRGEGNSRLTSRHATQAEAERAAQEIARNERSEVVIHRPDGRIRDRNSYGNDPFPPKG